MSPFLLIGSHLIFTLHLFRLYAYCFRVMLYFYFIAAGYLMFQMFEQFFSHDFFRRFSSWFLFLFVFFVLIRTSYNVVCSMHAFCE
ncbi:hypothetical protein BJ742DRAFT_456858 [Cladochytrium replicatum]|nr:hypothetical protein BJ742DRAFT_456858 [Cladochytrium replicatum]